MSIPMPIKSMAATLHDAIQDWASTHQGVYVEQGARDLVENFIAVADATDAVHGLRGLSSRAPEAATNLKTLLDASITTRGTIGYDDIIKALASLCPLYPFC